MFRGKDRKIQKFPVPMEDKVTEIDKDCNETAVTVS